MAKESNIKEELLRQMAENCEKTSDPNVKSAQEIVARDTARVKRMKWVTIVTWLFVAVFFIAAAIVAAIPGPHNSWWTAAAAITLQALLLIAVIFTVSFLVRSRTANMRQIQARLSSIETALKKMSEEK